MPSELTTVALTTVRGGACRYDVKNNKLDQARYQLGVWWKQKWGGLSPLRAKEEQNYEFNRHNVVCSVVEAPKHPE
jgi:hypothetical protein